MLNYKHTNVSIMAINRLQITKHAMRNYLVKKCLLSMFSYYSGFFYEMLLSQSSLVVSYDWLYQSTLINMIKGGTIDVSVVCYFDG